MQQSGMHGRCRQGARSLDLAAAAALSSVGHSLDVCRYTQNSAASMKLQGLWEITHDSGDVVSVCIQSGYLCMSQIINTPGWGGQQTCDIVDQVFRSRVLQMRTAPVRIQMGPNRTLLWRTCVEMEGASDTEKDQSLLAHPSLPRGCRLVTRGRGLRKWIQISALDMAQMSRVGIIWSDMWKSAGSVAHVWGARAPPREHDMLAGPMPDGGWQRLEKEWHECDEEWGWGYVELFLNVHGHVTSLEDAYGFTGRELHRLWSAARPELLEALAAGIGLCLPVNYTRSQCVQELVVDVIPLWLKAALGEGDTTFHSPPLSMGSYLFLKLADPYRYHLEASAERMRLRADAPESAAPVRVAFCIRGGVRSFPEPEVYQTIRDNLVAALGASESRIFYVLNLTDTSCTWCNEQKVVSVDFSALAAPFAALPPAALVLEPPRRSPASAADFGRCRSAALLPQFDGLWTCYRLVEEYERLSGVRFDWLVRTRPDLKVVQPLGNIRSFDPTRIHVLHREWFDVSDRFALIPRALVEEYLSAFGVPGGEDGYRCYSHSEHTAHKCFADDGGCQLRDHLRSRGVLLGKLPSMVEKVWPKGFSSDVMESGIRGLERGVGS